jgi:hypothetical protein
MTKPVALTTLILLALTSSAIAAMDSNRIVTAVDKVTRSFSCHAKPGWPSWTYKTTNKTVIRKREHRVRVSHIWHRGHFSDIKVGEIVSIQYHLEGGDRIAERVIIDPAR